MAKKSDDRMELILWRHAEAEDGTPSLPDVGRRLTARGEKQANKIARWLRTRLPRAPHILVSPAERTRMTALALGLPFETDARIGSEADAGDVLAAAGWPERGGIVVVVGHQPVLGRVASWLLTNEESDLAIKKGAVWWFSSRAPDEGRTTVLRAVINPDLI